MHSCKDFLFNLYNLQFAHSEDYWCCSIMSHKKEFKKLTMTTGFSRGSSSENVMIIEDNTLGLYTYLCIIHKILSRE